MSCHNGGDKKIYIFKNTIDPTYAIYNKGCEVLQNTQLPQDKFNFDLIIRMNDSNNVINK